MAKTVNYDDDFQKIKTEVDNLRKQLNTLKTTYSSNLEEINANYQAIANLDSDNWSDDVERRLKETLKTHIVDESITPISNDLSSGGMAQLISVLDKLYINLADASYSKQRYENAKRKLSLPEDDPDRPTEGAVAAYKREINDYISTINAQFVNLASIQFGGTALDEVEDVRIVLDPVERTLPEKETKPTHGEITYSFSQMNTLYDSSSYGYSPVHIATCDGEKICIVRTGEYPCTFKFCDPTGKIISDIVLYKDDVSCNVPGNYNGWDSSDGFPNVKKAVEQYLNSK